MSDEQTMPKWGDPISTIPPERQEYLKQLAEEQRAWVAATGSDRDPKRSPFGRMWDADEDKLTGAEVFFLAAEAKAAERGITLAEAEQQVRTDRISSHAALHLEGADLSEGHLVGAQFSEAHLEGADLSDAHLEYANFRDAHLDGSDLRFAHLENAGLGSAHLEGANLHWAYLESADLFEAHLEGANLDGASLAEADLNGAFFSAATGLRETIVFDAKRSMPRVADVRWQDVNLAVISWPDQPMLGDEHKAREKEQRPLQLRKDVPRERRQHYEATRHATIIEAWRTTSRAYRQLATTMRNQGMSDEADRFAYRGNTCQRQLYRVQGKHLRRFGSWLLDLISGYGYRPLRSVATYLLIVALFGLAYWALSVLAGHALTWNEAGVVSLTAFHGRGFFSTAFSPGDPQAALAAIEAVIGLLIEITFIATFTQRFFAR